MGAFKSYLHEATSHRNYNQLSRSSINTYHSSIKMFLLTYLRNSTLDSLWNGHIDAVLRLERVYGNNANYSMQQCAFRHFFTYMEPHRPDELAPFTLCERCLCGCARCHVDGCPGTTRCFGKCCKLVSRCSLSEDGICAYCLEKYPILYSDESTRRSRYLEYVHDHALIGRAYEPGKHDRMIRGIF